MAGAVIGLVGPIIGVINMGLSINKMIPKEDAHQTVVRVAAGLSKVRSDTLSGNKPGVTLYDVMGRQIGTTKGSSDKVLDGDFIDISVPFDEGIGKEPTEYLSIVNGGDDALCIAYISLTQPDGDKKIWYGDVGQACGAPWYHSQRKTGDNDYQPACVWVDRNLSGATRFQGFGMHINDFAGTEARAQQYEKNRDLMCKVAPRFKMYENLNSEDTIPYFSPPLEYVKNDLTDKDTQIVLDKSHWALQRETKHMNKAIVDGDPEPAKFKRSYNNSTLGYNNSISGYNNSTLGSSNSTRIFNDIVISESRWHSAKELCESPNSAGSDFVSLTEGLLCDMNSRLLWPLCTPTKQSGCFDQATSQMRAGSGLRGRDVDTGAYPPKKSYEKTVRWS